MLHSFTTELGAGWTVVRSTELAHDPNPISTYLRSVTQRGWIRQSDGSYDRSQSLPPVEFRYSQPTIDPELHDLDPQSLANLPVGIEGRNYQLLDLDSEGLPGILTQQGGAFFYKRNDGDGQFAPMARLATRPSIAELGSGVQQITDLDGSGGKFLVQLGRSPQGYSERQGNSWGGFRPFKSLPNLDWDSPELKYLDLDGDGLPDILKPEANLFRWWGSLGRDGYGAEHRVTQPRDDEKAPVVVWTDPRQAIVIADMTGDGLPDIVRITNGSVSYWPNRGYGRFGAKVVMQNAPRFTRPEAFNPAYLCLADIDGSGTADLIYLENGVARIWLNQSGNGYSNEQRVPFAQAAGATVMVADLLGKGTACLVWSSALPANRGRQMSYLDLMSGIKPHLLVSVVNHLGAATKIEYRPSTEYYLEDRRAGRPWVTKLPFPVQVLARVEVHEAVTGTKLVTTYRYHHGHYDGIEREFAGFGMVEQEDAETVQAGTAPPEVYTPPKRTKTWFHTGAFFDGETISTQYAHEYSQDFPQLVPDSVLPTGVLPEEAREAARALRGHMLRQEVYGLDGLPLEAHPYLVTESNFEVRRLQPKAGNRYGVFCVHPRETLTAHTERNPADPRNEHELTLAVDDFGNVLESVHIAYPRAAAQSEPAQKRMLVTYAQHDYLTLTDAVDFYRVDLLRESRTYELTGLPDLGTKQKYDWTQIADLLKGNPKAVPPVPAPAGVDFAAGPPAGSTELRLIERTKHDYVGDDTNDDRLRALALPVEVRRAALTPTLVAHVYNSLVTDQVLKDNKYVNEDGLWWAPSGQTDYGAEVFFQAKQFTDPFGNVSSVEYDGYALAVKSASGGANAKAPGYATTVFIENDYRVLAPAMITDANGNRAQAGFDALGRVTATWVMGKDTEQKGDDPAHPSTRIEYHLDVIPAFVYVEKREEHYFTDPSNQKLQRAYTYSDGLGREVLTKKQAELDTNGDPQWVGSGRTIFDNKGNPVKKYEPYFSPQPDYEVVVQGASDLLHYDPIGRVVRIDHPNGSYSRVEFNAWTQTTYDENDTVGEAGNAWYAKFSAGTPEQQDAAAKALKHANTPTTVYVDPLGRIVVTQQHNIESNGSAAFYRTTLDLDIQGNQRVVTDARSIAVATHVFDMLGRKLFTHSVDAGDSTVLLDALRATAHEWNPNSIEIEREYDPLRRSRRVWVTENGQKRLAERTFYGETLTDGAAHNLRGRVYQQLDGAGLVTHADYDFKGNLLVASRRVLTDYKSAASWTDVPDPGNTGADLGVTGLDTESFGTTTAYDALNRIIGLTVPSGAKASDGSSLGDHVSSPTYNEAGLLETISVKFAGDAASTPFVSDIDYNEKGQRLKTIYGNGATTVYSYEKDTFRLSTIGTTKTPTTPQPDLQALSYTYDPVGNITTINDAAQQTYFVGNSVVKPTAKYAYDAIYRLINAQGREHTGQAGMDQTSTPDRVLLPNPNDPTAMRNYAQKYEYDAVGNFLSLIHQVPDAKGQWANAWTRTYTPDASSNRLLSTMVGDGSTSTTVAYLPDEAGNITKMQGGSLPTLDWNYRNELIHAISSRGETYFTYDAGGQRVRKVIVNGSTLKERIYLGAYEIYRERPATGAATLERRTLHVNDGPRRIALVETLTVGTPATPTSVNDGPAQLIRYQLDNHLGSASLELDQAAGVLSYEEYHPFGTTSYRATAGSLGGNPKRFSFMAKEREEETGLSYFGARYHAPWLGRWIATDPAGMTDGSNLFVAFKNNPIRFVDPDGQQSTDPDVSRHGRKPTTKGPAPTSDQRRPPSYHPSRGAAHHAETKPEEKKETIGKRFIHPEGAVSPYKRVYGTFDGSHFVLTGELKSGGSRELLNVGAQSGRPYSVSPADAAKFHGSTKDSYLNNPRYVGSAEQGPIPEGKFRFYATDLGLFGPWERYRLIGKGGIDPFGKEIHAGDWGAGRAPLTPLHIEHSPFGGDPSRRSGFYVHGGRLDGSSGCIDIGNSGIEKLAESLAGYRGPIDIDVHYKGPAPDVGSIKRIEGRFVYPPQKDPSVWDRIKSAFGSGTEH
jgi:RHS repeat-associated protein